MSSSSRSTIGLIVLLLATTTGLLSAADRTGKQIYRAQCINCHGEAGQGSKKYDEPLTGNWSLAKLTAEIEKTMPDGKADLCVGEDAAKVAKYIYEAFYSPAAQARNQPARVMFSRLTRRQYEESIADLMGEFLGRTSTFSDERGLTGTWYKARGYNNKQKAFDRVEGPVDFNWGAGAPEGEGFKADEFSARWRGSLFTAETGTYEFIVKTENGIKLWVNSEKPILDAWVSDGQMKEHRVSLRLLGGRAVPIALDFFKWKDKTASIELRWKPPHGVEEIIPRTQFMPKQSARVFTVQTPLPPDDSSYGFARGISVSKAWDEATTHGALETAARVVHHMDRLAGTREDDPQRRDKVRAFAARFVAAAFRRPLTEPPRKVFVDAFFANDSSPADALKRTVILALKSPRFLYPDLHSPEPDAHQIAARLALLLWDSVPDRSLQVAIQSGNLKTPNHVRAQANRMMRDPRARAKLQHFFQHWLELDKANAIDKNTEAFPEFNQHVVADLRQSLRLFLDETMWSGSGDYRDLLKADHLYLNDRLGKFYGTEVTSDGFEKISMGPNRRAGVLTHPLLLAQFAYADNTSPIHRGVFLARHIAGRTLRPPPNAIQFKDSEFKPDQTMREKVTHLTKAADCMSCHSIINPLGFALENFDAIGRWRTKEKGRPINSSSEYITATNTPLKLTGPRTIANYAADSPHGQRHFIEQLFNHLAKQAPGAFGRETLDELWQDFVKTDCNVPRLMTEITVRVAGGGLTHPGKKQ